MPAKKDSEKAVEPAGTQQDRGGSSDKPDKGRPESKNDITLVFIINGEEVAIEANLQEPLAAARNQALAKSQNTGRPPNEWEIRNQAGQLLSSDGKVGSFGFEDGVHLYANLKVGAGGE